MAGADSTLRTLGPTLLSQLLDESYRLSYRTMMDELLEERAAEVLDGLSLLRREAKLTEEATNLMVSNAFDTVGGVFSMSSSAHISKHALSHYLAPLSGRCGAAC
jgi:hypothetical protein